MTEWQITSIQAGLDDLDGDSAGFVFFEGARNVAVEGEDSSLISALRGF